MALRWSNGGGAAPYARGTPVLYKTRRLSGSSSFNTESHDSTDAASDFSLLFRRSCRTANSTRFHSGSSSFNDSSEDASFWGYNPV